MARTPGSITYTSDEGITIELEEYVQKQEEERRETEAFEIRQSEIAKHRRPVIHTKVRKRRDGRRVFSTKRYAKWEVYMENERRKGVQGSTTVRMMDAMAAAKDKGYTNKEMCNLLGVSSSTISGTISEVYQALSKKGKIIREFDERSGANRYVIEEGVTAEGEAAGFEAKERGGVGTNPHHQATPR